MRLIISDIPDILRFMRLKDEQDSDVTDELNISNIIDLLHIRDDENCNCLNLQQVVHLFEYFSVT